MQSIYYKELAHAIQEAKSHHPQGKPGKLVVPLLNSSLSATTPEPGAARVSLSPGPGGEASRPTVSRGSKPRLSRLLSRAPAAACMGSSTGRGIRLALRWLRGSSDEATGAQMTAKTTAGPDIGPRSSVTTQNTDCHGKTGFLLPERFLSSS